MQRGEFGRCIFPISDEKRAGKGSLGAGVKKKGRVHRIY